MIDGDLVGAISSVNLQFDSLGKEINMDAEVDAYQYYAKELEFLKGFIAEGNDYAKSALVELNAAIAITKALEEYGKGGRERSLVNIRV